MQTSSYRSLQERREGLEPFQTSRSRGRMRRVGRRIRRMRMTRRRRMGKRRSEDDMQDRLVFEEGMIFKLP